MLVLFGEMIYKLFFGLSFPDQLRITTLIHINRYPISSCVHYLTDLEREFLWLVFIVSVKQLSEGFAEEL